MSERKPQKGDRVRVTFEAEFEGDGLDGSTARVKVTKGGMPALISIADESTVEVLEPADDPTRDPIWTVRTVEPAPGGADGNTVVKFGDSYWLYPSKLGNGYGRLDWSCVTDSKVIGVVPGTPAAEQNPVPPQVLARVREMLNNGQRIRAIKAIREAAVGLGLKSAKEYAKSLPEWEVAERVSQARLGDAVLGEGDWNPRTPEDPPTVTYRQHYRSHIVPEAGCEYCPPEQVQP